METLTAHPLTKPNNRKDSTMNVQQEINRIATEIDDTTDLYRACRQLATVMADPHLPEGVRMALEDEISHTVNTIIQQLDYSHRDVVGLLFPLVITLSKDALFTPKVK